MVNVPQLEHNLLQSFKKVKSDILRLNTEVNKTSNAVTRTAEEETKLAEKIGSIADRVTALEITFETMKKEMKQKKVIVANAPKPEIKVIKQNVCPPKKFVASKTGKKFHLENCIFAKNIRPKMRVTFKSKKAYLNKGYKPCHCVLK